MTGAPGNDKASGDVARRAAPMRISESLNCPIDSKRVEPNHEPNAPAGTKASHRRSGCRGTILGHDVSVIWTVGDNHHALDLTELHGLYDGAAIRLTGDFRLTDYYALRYADNHRVRRRPQTRGAHRLCRGASIRSGHDQQRRNIRRRLREAVCVDRR